MFICMYLNSCDMFIFALLVLYFEVVNLICGRCGVELNKRNTSVDAIEFSLCSECFSEAKKNL